MRVSIRDYDNLPNNPITIFWNELQTRVKNKHKHQNDSILLKKSFSFSIRVVD